MTTGERDYKETAEKSGPSANHPHIRSSENGNGDDSGSWNNDDDRRSGNGGKGPNEEVDVEKEEETDQSENAPGRQSDHSDNFKIPPPKNANGSEEESNLEDRTRKDGHWRCSRTDPRS